jgi:hypothetical protein
VDRQTSDPREEKSVFHFHPLSTTTRDRLIAGGLDPDDLAGLVRLAIREDLMGGIDVTSVATIAAAQRSRGVFAARAAGVVAGLSVAAAVVEAVCGEEASDEAEAEDTAANRLRVRAERDDLEVGWFVPQSRLDDYLEEERVYVLNEQGQRTLRKHPKGTFIYRLAGRDLVEADPLDEVFAIVDERDARVAA